MKLLTLSLFALSITAFAQSEQSLKINDNGPVIIDKTCSLSLDNKILGNKRLSLTDLDEVRVLLSKKGYRVSQAENRINLKLSLNGEVKEHYFTAELNSQIFNNEVSNFNLMPIFKSTSFKKSISDDGYELRLKKRAKRSLNFLINKLPQCKTLDSVHHYEATNYNPSLVTAELNSCEEAIDGVSYNPETTQDIHAQMFVGTYGGASSLLVGALMPSQAFLALGLGVTSYIIIRAINKNKRKYFTKDNKAFYQNLRTCYEYLQAGKACEGVYSNFLTQNLSKKAKKNIDKFLSHMSSEELTLKIADYLATIRPCSTQLATIDKINKKRKKIKLQNVLNEVKGSL